MKTFESLAPGPLLMLFLAMGLVISVVGVLPISPVAANNPDFTLTVSPTSATVQRGSSATFGIGLTGVCGLTGTINVFAGISPNVSKEPTLQFTHYDICCFSSTHTTGGTVLTVGTEKGTARTTYTITVTAHTITCPLCVSNSIYHSASVTLTVT